LRVTESIGNCMYSPDPGNDTTFPRMMKGRRDAADPNTGSSAK